MLKKILATALAAAMIFGLAASTAFAATFSDIAGNKNEAAIKRLAAVGIFGGYPDGTFKPGNPITRAEFSKIIVVALGFADTAEMMATVPTGFSDVPVDHWANGFISVAASQGIVKGDPAGTFRPDANVTYAEAITMVMRALGYEPVLKNGVWPTAYLTKATSIGIIGSLSFVANAPATRGDVATLLSNSLTEPWLEETEWDSNGNPVRFAVPEEEEDQQTFLDAMGFSKSSTKVLVDSPELFGNDGETVQLDGEPADTLAADAEYAGLLGHRVVFWYNSSGDVFFIEDKTSASDVRTAEFDEVDEADDEVFVEINDKAVDVDGLPMILNYGQPSVIQAVYADPDVRPDAGDEITVIYYDGDPIYVLVNRYTYNTVKAVNTVYDKITFQEGGSISLKDFDVTFTGDAEALEDLEEFDVLQYIYDEDNEKAIVHVTRDSVTGEFKRLSGDVGTIGGTKYDAGPGFTFDSDLLGDDVTIYLNAAGEVQWMETAEEDAETVAGVVVAKGFDINAYGVETGIVKIFTAEGETVELTCTSGFYNDGDPDSDPDAVVWDDLAVGDVIEYELSSSGKLAVASVKAAFADIAPAVPTDPYEIEIDDDDLLITDGSGTYRLTASTVIFDLSGFAGDDEVIDDELDLDATHEWIIDPDADEGDLDVMTLGDLLENAEIAGVVANSAGKATYVMVLDGDAEEDEDLYGYVVDTFMEDDEDGLVILADGVETEYLADVDVSGVAEDDVVLFDVAGGRITAISEPAKLAPPADHEWRVAAVSDGVVKIQAYSTLTGDPDENEVYSYVTNGDSLFFDASGSTAESMNLEDLALDSVVDVYLDSGVIAVLVVTE